MKKLTFILLSFLILTSCAQTKPKTDTKESKSLICKVKISFGSRGTGIDGKTFDSIMALIEEKKLKYSKKNMGREGETELCLPLTEFKRSKKADFIERLKKITSSGQLVSLSVD